MDARDWATFEAVQTEISKLMHVNATEHWQEIDTEKESRAGTSAIVSCNRAGLIELKLTLKTWRMDVPEDSRRVTCIVTGDYRKELPVKVGNALNWLDCQIRCQPSAVVKYRLTPMGVSARKELLAVPHFIAETIDNPPAPSIAIEEVELQAESQIVYSAPDTPNRWARRFRISLDTLHRRINAGKVRAKKDSTHSWRIAVADLPSE